MISAEDRLAIIQVIDLYGHLIDERQWDRLDEMFWPDIIYDISAFSCGIIHGIEALRLFWSGDAVHPVAHHATNIVIRPREPECVMANSKGIGVGAHGKVGSAVYRDVIRKSGQRWRIAHRVCSLRSANDTIDPGTFAAHFPPGCFET